MKIGNGILAGLTLISLAGFAAAQDTTEAEAPAETAPAETATDAPADAAQDAAQGEAQAGQAPEQPEFTTEIFGDWEVRCNLEKTNCFMYQLARDEGLNPVAEFSLLKLPEGGEAAAGVTAVTPLGTLLSEGMVVQVDSSAARRYEYSWCTRSGCFSRFGFTTDDVAALKRGSVARVRIVSVSAPERPILLELSLTGFTAAFDAMSTAN